MFNEASSKAFREILQSSLPWFFIRSMYMVFLGRARAPLRLSNRSKFSVALQSSGLLHAEREEAVKHYGCSKHTAPLRFLPALSP